MNNSCHISLRALEPSDLDCLYLWENDPAMWCHGVSSAPYSRHQLWEYIHTYDADPLRSGQLRLVVTCGEKPVGCIDLYNIDPLNSRAFVGIMIATECRRTGYALQALTHINLYARAVLHLHQLIAVIATDNIPSVNLFSRAGYKHTATLHEWIKTAADTYIDACVLQLIV